MLFHPETYLNISLSCFSASIRDNKVNPIKWYILNLDSILTVKILPAKHVIMNSFFIDSGI